MFKQMKNFIAILAFTIVSTPLISCGEEKVINLGSLQQRGDVYVVPETQKPYSGKFIETTYGNIVVTAGSLKNGKLNGKLERYGGRGQLIWTVNFKDGIIVDVQRGSFTDPRDGKAYKTTKIGSQTWFAENLNYDTSGSKCYGDNPSNCQKYGRLYNWNTAMKACPSGWHLPSKDEAEAWEKFFGGSNVAGKMLKATSGWNYDGNGTDDLGFSALPGGGIFGGSIGILGDYGGWWSSSEHNNDAHYRSIYYLNGRVDWSYADKSCLISVRCLKD